MKNYIFIFLFIFLVLSLSSVSACSTYVKQTLGDISADLTPEMYVGQIFGCYDYVEICFAPSYSDCWALTDGGYINNTWSISWDVFLVANATTLNGQRDVRLDFDVPYYNKGYMSIMAMNTTDPNGVAFAQGFDVYFGYFPNGQGGFVNISIQGIFLNFTNGLPVYNWTFNPNITTSVLNNYSYVINNNFTYIPFTNDACSPWLKKPFPDLYSTLSGSIYLDDYVGCYDHLYFGAGDSYYLTNMLFDGNVTQTPFSVSYDNNAITLRNSSNGPVLVFQNNYLHHSLIKLIFSNTHDSTHGLLGINSEIDFGAGLKAYDIPDVYLSATNTQEQVGISNYFEGYDMFSVSYGVEKQFADTSFPQSPYAVVSDVNDGVVDIGAYLATSSMDMPWLTFDYTPNVSYYVINIVASRVNEPNGESVASSFYVYNSQKFNDSELRSSNSFIGTSTAFLLGIFPAYTDLSVPARWSYVVFAIFGVSLVFLFLSWKVSGTVNKTTMWITAIFDVVLFLFFVSIDYIPISIVIIFSLVIILIAFLKIKGGS